MVDMLSYVLMNMDNPQMIHVKQEQEMSQDEEQMLCSYIAHETRTDKCELDIKTLSCTSEAFIVVPFLLLNTLYAVECNFCFNPQITSLQISFRVF